MMQNVSPAGSIPSTVQWVFAPPARPQSQSAYATRRSVILGVILITCGVLSVVFNIVDLAVSGSFYGDDYYDSTVFSTDSLGFVGHGLWSGLMCVAAGIPVLVAGRKRTKCSVRASLVLCILAACFTLGQLATSCIGIAILSESDGIYCCSDDCNYYWYYYGHYPNSTCRKVQTLIAMESLLALMSLVGGICAIVLSSIACKAGCCCCCCEKQDAIPGQPLTFVQDGVHVSLPSQQQGVPVIGYPFQYPLPAYNRPASFETLTHPPPSYDQQQIQQIQQSTFVPMK